MEAQARILINGLNANGIRLAREQNITVPYGSIARSHAYIKAGSDAGYLTI